MASSNSLTSQLAQLQQFEKSKDYPTIIDTFDSNFDSIANEILQHWISKQTLSKDEKKYLDSYSKIQLSYIKYCSLHLDTTTDVQTLIEKLPELLFQRTQVDKLATAVEFIREEQSTDPDNDFILNCLMRMIDARALAYRCVKNIRRPPTLLNDELKDSLLHRQAKNYLYDVISDSENNRKISIDIRHQFFIGCCTFAVALYGENKGKLTNNDKYVYLLVKYVRILLSREDLKGNDSMHYCLRGIFALLTNYIPHEYWLNIMNNGLKDEADENAQKKNPFNLNLFSLIINQLLASNILQKKTEESTLNDQTLLIDTVLVFLVKWSDTQQDLDDDQENKTNRANSSVSDQPNQLLRCLQSQEDFKQTAQILVPYIDAKYDRIRLMTLSILSNIMSDEDFEDLPKQKPNMAKDLIELLFDFIDQAAKQPDHVYKGIPFETLLHSLHRFLVQDFIKEATLPYISKIVQYAKSLHIYALKILLKISTSPKLRDDLSKDKHLKTFLDQEANIIYGVHKDMFAIIEYIRQNLTPPPSKKAKQSVSNNRQAFISYCHEDKVMCEFFKAKLDETKIFRKIWIDKEYMKDQMIGTVARAMSDSKVVFILLSDSYCQSDFCRMEWTYAIEEKIATYVAVVNEDFKRSKYDWVRFSISGKLYYKMYNDDDLQKLIRHVSEFVNEPENGRLENEEETKPKSLLAPLPVETKPKTPSASLPVKPKAQPTNQDYLKKRSLETWTSEDVQNWCIVTKQEKWCELLNNYDGSNLLALRKDLSKESFIQHVVKGNSLDGIDVARFKNETDKLLAQSKTNDEPVKSLSSSLDATKDRPIAAKQPKQRRLSKTTKK